MSWRGLRYKGTEVLRSTEWNAVVDALNDLYGMFTSGQSDLTVDELNARTARFRERPRVGGRPVLLDDDPVHIASFYDMAKRQITEAVDASQLYNIWRRAVDEYGRVGVRIYEPVDTEGRVVVAAPVELMFELSPVSATGSVSVSSNTSGLTVQLNKGGRPHVNVYYALGGPGTVYVEVSLDGSTWRLLDTITLSLPGNGVKIYQGVAYPYVRVRTALTGADVAFEIVASR
ncbi:MAG: hypothetical protein ACO2PN_11205 [Pyrobaculum sp.]|jgi:hypothetical protein